MSDEISTAINNLISEYDVCPYEINNGLCEEFMRKVTSQIPASEECCTGFVLNNEYMKYPIHVWIYYDGKHYDAESPNGVLDFRDLSFFTNISICSEDIIDNKFTI